MLIFQFKKFQKLAIRKIPRIYNLKNFRMAEVSKLRIHERSNLERPNLLVLITKIGNKN